jgi:hypothetical protein
MVAICILVIFSCTACDRAETNNCSSQNGGVTNCTNGASAVGGLPIGTPNQQSGDGPTASQGSGVAPGSGGPAQAAPATLPSSDITFSFDADHVDQGTSPQLTYSVSHLPAGAELVLQQRQASATDWASARALAAQSGSVAAPAVSLGKYEYRVLVTLDGSVIATSVAQVLYVYGSVPLSTLCAVGDVTGDGGCDGSTIPIGGTAFNYSGSVGSYYPNYYQVFTLSSTTCDSLTVVFGSNDPTAGDHAYLEIVQSGSGTLYKTIPTNEIATVTAPLDGGPLIFGVSEDDADGYSVFFKGSASCYSENGT